MAVKIEKVASKYGEITLATITNSHGASVVLSSLGAGVTAINVPDAAGNIDNVITTYADPADFMAAVQMVRAIGGFELVLLAIDGECGVGYAVGIATRCLACAGTVGHEVGGRAFRGLLRSGLR